jgi:NCS2 family nucleobase:cation symporter-2
MAVYPQSASGRTQTVHPFDEVLPAPQLIAFGLQHVLSMYDGAVAVPLIVGAALGLMPEQVIVY